MNKRRNKAKARSKATKKFIEGKEKIGQLIDSPQIDAFKIGFNMGFKTQRHNVA